LLPDATELEAVSDVVLVAPDSEEGEAAPEAKPRTRNPADLDHSHVAPFGASLRRYKREGHLVWTGVLPRGMFDDIGRHSRTRSWTGPRAEYHSEVATKDAVLTWLRDWSG